jgi:hypothetical protein
MRPATILALALLLTVVSAARTSVFLSREPGTEVNRRCSGASPGEAVPRAAMGGSAADTWRSTRLARSTRR